MAFAAISHIHPRVDSMRAHEVSEHPTRHSVIDLPRPTLRERRNV
jgi:hypothetical protein